MQSDKETKGMTTEEPNCYKCTHHNVCEYFRRVINGRFPFKSDDFIKGYIDEQAKTLAKACLYFEERLGA